VPELALGEISHHEDCNATARCGTERIISTREGTQKTKKSKKGAEKEIQRRRQIIVNDLILTLSLGKHYCSAYLVSSLKSLSQPRQHPFPASCPQPAFPLALLISAIINNSMQSTLGDPWAILAAPQLRRLRRICDKDAVKMCYFQTADPFLPRLRLS